LNKAIENAAPKRYAVPLLDKAAAARSGTVRGMTKTERMPLGIICLLPAGFAAAETTCRATTSGYWSNAGIWNQPAAPMNDADAKINIETGDTVKLISPALISRLVLGDNAHTGSLVIDGGVFYGTVTNRIPTAVDETFVRLRITDG
jgi:hypothetical protein